VSLDPFQRGALSRWFGYIYLSLESLKPHGRSGRSIARVLPNSARVLHYRCHDDQHLSFGRGLAELCPYAQAMQSGPVSAPSARPSLEYFFSMSPARSPEYFASSSSLQASSAQSLPHRTKRLQFKAFQRFKPFKSLKPLGTRREHSGS
jgi:hypothetical protein